MSLLIKLVILLGVVVLLVAAMMFWSHRRQRKREESIRKRGPDATITSEHPPKHKTDRWNISG